MSKHGSQGRKRMAERAIRRALLEALEERALFSTVVTTTADSGPGSLRQAILDANAAGGMQTITFAIPAGTTGQVEKISVMSALPQVTGQVTIDGTTQPGYAGQPLIQIDGSASAQAGTALAVGLELTGSGETVRGLALEGFAQGQIELSGAGGDTVAGNVIGLGRDLTAPGVQNGSGIIISSSGNTIGGAGVGDRNILAGNGWNGITISGGTGNTVQGNYIGLEADGATGALNNNNGIEVDGAGGVTIRGNVISANNGDGILLANVPAAGATIAGNIIGLDATGALARPNTVNGIELTDSANVTIGGTGAGDRNVISSNDADGIRVAGGSGDVIEGNFIGTDGSGTAAADASGTALGNSGNGITVGTDTSNPSSPVDPTGLQIGTAGAGNVVAGSGGNGIQIDTSGNGTLIEANLVGTDASGLKSVDAAGQSFANAGDGIAVNSGGATIGGSASGEGNVVSGNGNNGINLGAASVVEGNLIGVGLDGTTPLPNAAGAGVYANSSGDVIGGTAAGEGNIIAYNSQGGVVVFGEQDTIRGNSIFSNTALGIDLGGNGVTLNDSAGHAGANGYQNFPVIGSAVSSAAGSVTVSGQLSAAAGTYSVDFYSSPDADGSGYGQGKTYLGSVTVTVDASGTGSFSASLSYPAATDLFVSATATDASGNTSEFAQTAGIVVQAPMVDQTITQLASSVNPSAYGQAVTLTANVSDATRPGLVPTGSVRFVDGTTVLGTVAVGANGSAALALASLAVGSHVIMATYVADAGWNNSTSGPVTQAVNAAATSTSLSSSLNPATVGQAVTFTAVVSVAAPGAGTPTGTITFSDGTTVLGTVAVDASGAAALTVGNLTVGGHTITASYSGDGDFGASTSPTLNETVQQAATSTMLTSSNPVATVGQAVTLTATVGTTATGTGTPGGQVTFTDGSMVLGTVSLSGGTASLTSSTLAVGTHPITATYSSDVNFTGSNAALNQGVVKDDTSTMLTASASAVNSGDAVTFTATVSGATAGSGTPTGSVTFMDGSTVLGSGTISGGVATLTSSALAVGGHTITAVYGGDGNFNGSTSGPVSVTVNAITGTLSGRTLSDATGNGLSSDDTPLAGVTVSLYRDVNNDGVYDAADGSAVATTVSDGSGVYSFTGVGVGNYLVKESVPSGYVETAPALSDVYAVSVSGGGTQGGLDFDNFKKCATVVTNVSFKVGSGCGTQAFTDLRGHTQQGETVTATFTVGSGGGEVTLVTYDAPGATFDANTAAQQTIYHVSSQTFTAGVHTLTAQIPNSYYQIDFVTCEAIDHFGPAGSNIFYSAQKRLISADNAGTHSDVEDMSATTRFWAHLGQSLIKNFNVTSSNQSPTQLGNWLATNYPNLYGPGGANNLTNKTNTVVAQLMLSLYGNSARRTDASLLATALNVYASTDSLGGSDSASYGFSSTAAGLGAARFNVGSNGAAFNVANNSTLTVSQLLSAANAKSSKDVLYSGVTSMLTMAYNVFESINNAGGIS